MGPGLLSQLPYQGTPWLLSQLPSNLATIKLQERPNFEQMIRIMQQVALALQHLHDDGVVHGDLKPLNIVRSTEDGQEKYMLIDLDAAVRIGVDRVGHKYSSA